MVAYSFQRRFAASIAEGHKAQTIRADRRRHARPGEMLQLFTGMRTAACRKIIPDVRCTAVAPVTIDFDPEGKIHAISIGTDRVDDLDAFALADGFESLSDMYAFWTMAHGLQRQFRGVLICWAPERGASA
jgi:uncharacterized protein YqfB (UPF0267 family)